MTYQEAQAQMRGQLDGDEQRARAELQRFKQEFEKEASYAFEWCEGAFAAAARLDVIRLMRSWLQVCTRLSQLKDAIERRLLSEAAETGDHGTRQMLARYRIAAWADYHNALRYIPAEEPEVTP